MPTYGRDYDLALAAAPPACLPGHDIRRCQHVFGTVVQSVCISVLAEKRIRSYSDCSPVDVVHATQDQGGVHWPYLVHILLGWIGNLLPPSLVRPVAVEIGHCTRGGCAAGAPRPAQAGGRGTPDARCQGSDRK